MKLRSNLHGIGRHSLDEVAEFSFQDLEALSALLGNKQFFNGDSPSTFGMNCFKFCILISDVVGYSKTRNPG